MVSYKDLLQQWRGIYWKWVLENKDEFPDSDTLNMYNYTDFDSDWFWELISENINITWDTIYQNLEYPWDMSYVSKNKNITPDIVEKYPDMFSDWNWYYLCKNINFTLPVFLKNMDKDLNWCEISANPNITWEQVTQYPDLPWHYGHMSANKNITWKIIMENPDIDWCMSYYMHNPSFKLRDFLEDDNDDIIKTYGFREICTNPNITWDDIKSTPHLPWNENYDLLSKHPNITWDIITKNPDYPWYWRSICENPNITCEIIKANPEYPFVKKSFSENTNFRLDHLVNLPDDLLDNFYSDSWYISDFAVNDLVGAREQWISEQRLIIIKTLQIQRHWRRCSNDPSFKLAKKLINSKLTVN